VPETVSIAQPDAPPRARAALAFLLDAAGIPARRASPGEPALLVHGDAGPLAVDGIRIPASGATVAWPELAAGTVPVASLGDHLPIDLVALVAAHLDDSVRAEAPAEAFDGHGRLTAAGAAGGAAIDVPIVNHAVRLLADIARTRFGIDPVAAWPDARAGAVALSHDVDQPERYALLRDLARPWRLRRAPRTLLIAALRLARERLSDPAPDDHWAFDELLAAEEAAGVRSTFLFSVTPYHARSGCTLDPAYEADGPRYRRLYERLRTAGWEIGLHASYFAFRDPRRLATERAALSRLAGVEVRGLRHHYWQLGPDPAATLRAHEVAGFAYDASLGFNDAPGYRRGVALPFHPFDASLGRPIATLQLPTTLMDGNLFYQPISVDEAIERTIAQVELIRSVGGLAVIDWHSHTSVPSNRRFAAWGRAYTEILGWLARQPSLWIATLGEVAEWRTRRSAMLGHGPS
jgi:hypothetical protein